MPDQLRMTTERWRRIEEIYQAAPDLDPRERADMLKQTCGTDAVLRQEIENLLAENGDIEAAVSKNTVDSDVRSAELCNSFELSAVERLDVRPDDLLVIVRHRTTPHWLEDYDE